MGVLVFLNYISAVFNQTSAICRSGILFCAAKQQLKFSFVIFRANLRNTVDEVAISFGAM